MANRRVHEAASRSASAQRERSQLSERPFAARPQAEGAPQFGHSFAALHVRSPQPALGDPPAAAQAGEPNRTGLPDRLKAGVESLSGVSLDSVRVHFNSARPAQISKLAYAAGSDIHVAPGQERHLPHEAWHVVQQAQGRVRPTARMGDGRSVNTDRGLEHEADAMGAKALSPGAARGAGAPARAPLASGSQQAVIQGKNVGGIEVTFTPGYASWTMEDGSSWHINWRLGESSKKGEVYHVTNEKTKEHYFFTLSAGDISDASAPKGKKGQGGSSHKFSKLPASVQSYVTANISALMG